MNSPNSKERTFKITGYGPDGKPFQFILGEQDLRHTIANTIATSVIASSAIEGEDVIVVPRPDQIPDRLLTTQ